jgi:isoprenylcysteine carboxyl methyltransferase (ICMT) family protein YpbQ
MCVYINSSGLCQFWCDCHASWASLLSDIVDQNKMGEYFGWKNMVLGLIVVIAAFLAVFILQKLQPIFNYRILTLCIIPSYRAEIL